MKENRSASQILFGHLPEQTVDAAGGIWRVKKWNQPRIEMAIDPTALREELTKAAYPWSDARQDDGFVDDLFGRANIVVKSLNRDAGIWCEYFPRLWKCACKRLYDEPTGTCPCGTSRRRGQLPFVGYHDACGAIKTPSVRRCRTHGQRAVKLPGTAAATEIIFYCPVCNDVLHRGFNAACDCGNGALKFTVHRSGSVFKPRSIVMINPPRRDVLTRIENGGGGERALEWVLNGMQERSMLVGNQTTNPDTVRALLADRGFDASTIDAMIAAMPPEQGHALRRPRLNGRVKALAERQARQIALATFESRLTLTDLQMAVANPATKALYDFAYPAAMRDAGIRSIELVDTFPVLTAQFGFTRGDSAPGASMLRTYRERNGDYILYGDLIQTEALFVSLDPILVAKWLASRGHLTTSAAGHRDAMIDILESLNPPDSPNPFAMDAASKDLTTLLHSYAHAFIRKAAVFAGIDRSALSELVLPHALGFFVYAAARGDFVLGGLQALFETEMNSMLTLLVDDEYRCALDPGCGDAGSACAVCLHLGEPSCRMFNTHLSRDALAGGRGYLDTVAAS